MMNKQEEKAFRAGYLMGQSVAVHRLSLKIQSAIEEYVKEERESLDKMNAEKLTEEYLMDLVRLCDACYDLTSFLTLECKRIRAPRCEQIATLVARFPDMSKDEIAERLILEKERATEIIYNAYDKVNELMVKTGVRVPGLTWEALLDYLEH